jgi:hypothetical protein
MAEDYTFDNEEVSVPTSVKNRIYGTPGGKKTGVGQTPVFTTNTVAEALGNFQYGLSRNDPSALFIYNKMVDNGLVRAGAGFQAISSAYKKALDLTASMASNPDNKVTVLDAISILRGGTGPTGGGGAGGTSKEFTKYSETQLKQRADSAYNAILGRPPTAEEAKAFAKALIAGAKAAPAIYKTSASGKTRESQRGFDEGAFIAGYMANKIPETGDDLDGLAGEVQDLIDNYKESYGVNPTLGFINGSIKSIINAEDRGSAKANLEQQLKEQAQILYPALKDKISAGLSVRAIADPYIAKAAKLLEQNDMNIGLDNKYVSAALSRKNEKGEYELMSQDDYARNIRSSAEWLNTKNAKETFLGAADSILTSFGFIGR